METFEGKLVLGLPKGSLEAATCEIFRKAGYTINISSRSYYPTINAKMLAVPEGWLGLQHLRGQT